MVMRGFKRNFKPLEILTEEQVEAIHLGTLEVLEETGVRFESERALEVFERNDCRVDRDDMRVRIPGYVVEECLRRCPSSFLVKARDPKNDLRVGGDTLYFRSFPGMRTVDLDSWESRMATRKENADGVKVLDALDNLHLIGNYTPYFEVEGVPPAMAIPESVAAKMRYTTKFQWTGYQLGSEIFTIRMAKAIGIEIGTQCTASPPLTYYADAVEAAYRGVEAGFPIFVVSGAVYGGTGPATIAGSTITNNAELIAGVVLTQLMKPGTRVIVADFVFPLNMRAGSPAFGAIGCALHLVVFNQIWRRYGVPMYSSTMGLSSSKEIDFQCGYEKAIIALSSALSGSHVMGLYGGIHGELTWHPLQAILDDDIAGMIGRFIEGVEVRDETLAIDLIKEVGPIPGMYLDKEHTRKWWKKEQFVPKAADRLTYPEWMEKGKKAALDYAKERMEEILATHEPKPLTAEQEAEIERILGEAREYYRERGMM